MGSLAPLAVLKRLQRRNTNTMITTHKSAVLTVEFNELPPARHGDAPRVPRTLSRGVTGGEGTLLQKLQAGLRPPRKWPEPAISTERWRGGGARPGPTGRDAARAR